MSFIIGSTVPLSFSVFDEAGDPISAATDELTIELPDGTTVNPPLNETETGVYELDYVPAMVGRHSVYAVTTGPSAAFSDAFDVRAEMPRYMISLAAAKRALNLRQNITTSDAELLDHIEAATDAIELYLHETVVRRTVVERHDLAHPSVHLVLGTYPVVSVTSVESVDGLTVWTDPTLNPATGTLYTAGSRFEGAVTVTYVAGRREIPANYSRAAEMVVASLWQSQRIPVAGPRAPEEQMDMDRYGVVIPPRARELLGGTAPMVAAP